MCKEICEFNYSCVSNDFNNHKLFNEQQMIDIKKLVEAYNDLQKKSNEIEGQRNDIYVELKKIGAKHECRRLGIGRKRFGIDECTRCQMIKKCIEESKDTTIDSIKFLHTKLKQRHEEMKQEIKTITNLLQMSDSDDDF